MARFYGPQGGGDVSFTEEGCIVFPNDGEICNTANSSGDGSGLSTISINPDTGTESDQYIIIDPTVPNHIHIRAGGQIDNSAADLIIGGERTHVLVTDGGRDVAISTATTQDFNSYQNLNEESSSTFITLMPAVIDSGYVVSVDWNDYTVDSVTLDSPSAGLMSVLVPGATFTPEQMYTFVGDNGVNNNWYFDSNGTFLGPIEGLVKVDGIYGQNEFPLAIIGPESILLDGDSGEFLNDASVPSNQIATIGDIEASVPGSMTRYSPTFTATGLAFTGSGSTYPTYNSYYVKNGKMVSFVIEVDCTTITNFGTGQYKLQLPFAPAVGYNHFTGWANVDPAVNPDVPTGHVILNIDHLGITDILDLHYLKQAGGAHTPIVEGLFLQGTPVTLTTSSKIYVNGTYICQ